MARSPSSMISWIPVPLKRRVWVSCLELCRLLELPTRCHAHSISHETVANGLRSCSACKANCEYVAQSLNQDMGM